MPASAPDLASIAAQLTALQAQLAGHGGNVGDVDPSALPGNRIDSIPGAATERKPMRRIHGPYPHRARWRVVEVDLATGRRTNHHYTTREEADVAFARLQKEAVEEGGATVRQLLQLYQRHLADKGNKESSIHTTEVRVSGFLADVLHRSLRTLTVADLKATVAKTAGQAGDTRLNGAAETRTFLRWLRSEGHTRTDLAAAIKVVAKRRTTPKPMPRIDEARQLITVALTEAAKGDTDALAVAMLPLLGLRASELTTRTVRDIDDDGRVLWIPGGKTAAAARRLRLPEVIGAPLRALAAGRPPDAPLFPDKGRHWLTYQCKRLCKLAGIQLWRPHAWRRFHATMAVEAGATSEAVTRSLGHTSFATTTRSYADPSAVATARQAAVSGELGYRNSSPENAVDPVN